VNKYDNYWHANQPMQPSGAIQLNRLARQFQPGLIATDLLQSRTCPTIFVVLSFWLNEQEYRNDQLRPTRAALDQLLSNVSISEVDLGLFAFLAPTDSELKDITTQAETAVRTVMN
jgi:hypothetical protein